MKLAVLKTLLHYREYDDDLSRSYVTRLEELLFLLTDAA